MPLSYFELPYSQAPKPEWLARLVPLVNKNTFISKAFSWLTQLDKLSAKIIKHSEDEVFEKDFYSFRFLDPDSGDYITCHYSLIEDEEVVNLELSRKTESLKTFGQGAGRLAFSIRSIFSGQAVPELILENENDRRETGVNTTYRADLNKKTGEVEAFSTVTRRAGKVRLKTSSKSESELEALSPIFFRERHVLHKNQEPEIFTDQEPYQNELTYYSLVKHAEFWIDGGETGSYAISAECFAIYDSISAELSKVIVIFEIGKRYAPFTVDHKQAIEYRPDNSVDSSTWEAETVFTGETGEVFPADQLPWLKLENGGAHVVVPYLKLHPLVPKELDMYFPKKFPGLPANLNHAEPVVFTASTQF